MQTPFTNTTEDFINPTKSYPQLDPIQTILLNTYAYTQSIR